LVQDFRRTGGLILIEAEAELAALILIRLVGKEGNIAFLRGQYPADIREYPV
jgi:hypothetical protein